MTLTLNALLAMAWRTVKNPREGASEVLSLGIPREALWPALALVVVLSILLAQITAMTVAGSGMVGPMMAGPAVTGLFQLFLLVLMIFAIFWVGRAMGGRGTLDETALIVTWLQFIMVCLQVVQTVTLIVIPPLAGIVGVASLILFLWLLTNFVAEVHGFASLAQVFLMILVSAFGIAFVLSILLSIAGVPLTMMQP